MKRFVEGMDREQATLFPECLEDWIGEDNPVRVIDVFVDGLDLAELGFDRVRPQATGRPSYHPAVLLKLYIYGYLNRVQSSRRLEREAGRNVEVMWLIGRLVPDHKTIADFRKDSGPAIRRVCAQFVTLSRQLGLRAEASVAIDGSKSRAVNNQDRTVRRTALRAVADIHSTLERQILDLPEGEGIADVEHHREADHLRRAVEVAERILHPPTLWGAAPNPNRFWSDSAQFALTPPLDIIGLNRLSAIQL